MLCIYNNVEYLSYLLISFLRRSMYKKDNYKTLRKYQPCNTLLVAYRKVYLLETKVILFGI